MQDKITKCPACQGDNIEITYNHNIRRYTLSCFDCNGYYKINKNQAELLCPYCHSDEIIYDDIETYCHECGTILSSVPPVYVGGIRVKYEWGLIL